MSGGSREEVVKLNDEEWRVVLLSVAADLITYVITRLAESIEERARACRRASPKHMRQAK